MSKAVFFLKQYHTNSCSGATVQDFSIACKKGLGYDWYDSKNIEREWSGVDMGEECDLGN